MNDNELQERARALVARLPMLDKNKVEMIAHELRAVRAPLEQQLEGERLNWKQIHDGCHAERDELRATTARLTASNETLRAQLHGMQDGALVRDLQGQVERLTEERNHWKDDSVVHSQRAVNLERDIEELSCLLDRFQDALGEALATGTPPGVIPQAVYDRGMELLKLWHPRMTR